MPYFAEWLADRGFEVIEAPYAFSGQGDALAYGDRLLTAYGQRTDERMLRVLARELDYEVVPLRTAGCRWYDLDLAVGVIAPACWRTARTPSTHPACGPCAASGPTWSRCPPRRPRGSR
ncbi:hypothetical protein [Streptomyces stelliscabiei]|uniref:hypothetical protein n=1 Tax=Streptomyces stelliscabiei TaxID=146820 RepID=UPI002FF26DE9